MRIFLFLFLRFYTPLAAVGLLQVVTLLLGSGLLARTTHSTQSLAAFGVAWGSVTLLSQGPISMLQYVILAQGGDGIAVRRSFPLVTLVVIASFLSGAIVAHTALSDLYFGGLIGLDGPLLQETQMAFRLVIWSAFADGLRQVSWSQAIGQGQTRWVLFGTMARLPIMAALGYALLRLGWPDNALLGGIVIMVGMGTEGLVTGIGVWLRPKLTRLPVTTERTRPPANLMALVAFYLPLAGAGYLRTIMSPIIQAILGRQSDPVTSLAAFTLATQLASLVLAPLAQIHSLPLVYGHDQTLRRPIARFSAGLGAMATTLLILMIVTPAGGWILRSIIGAGPALVSAALVAILFMLPETFLMPQIELSLGLHSRGNRSRRILLSQVCGTIALVLAGLVMPKTLGATAGTLARVATSAGQYIVLRWRE